MNPIFQTIPRKILLNMAAVITLLVVFLGYLWVSQEYFRYKDESKRVWELQFDERKKQIKHQVEHVIDFIDYKRSQLESRAKDELQDEVRQAYMVADTIYKKYGATKSREEVAGLIREALRAIRFNDDRGYCFIFSMDGYVRMHGDRPELEGKNLLSMRDTEGALVIRDMIALMQKEKEAFYQYRWTKPGVTGKDFRKVSYLKYFEPMGWFIGAGEYLDVMEEQIKQEVLDRLSVIRFGEEGYVFVGRWDGYVLTPPAQGTNQYGVTDKNGVKIVQELIARAKEGGGYVEYVMPKFDGKRPLPKISYAQGIPQWQWYVGSGVYLDDIEDSVAAIQHEMRANLKRNVVKTVLILLAALLVAFLLSLRTAKQLKHSFDTFLGFFGRAGREDARIEAEKLPFAEFQRMAAALNQMIDKQQEADNALRRSEEKYRALIESTGTGFVKIDNQGRVLDANDEYVRLTGHEKLADIQGRNVREWTASYDLQRTAGEVERSFRQGYVRNLQVDYAGPDGTVIPVEINGTVVLAGEQPEGIAICRDISDKKRMEEQLRQAQKMEAIGTLAGGIAHDFNNILAAIMGYAEMAQRAVPEGNRAKADLEQVRRASMRAAELIRQILTFSRKNEQENKPICLQPIVKEALKLLRASIPTAIEIRQNIDLACGQIAGDPIQIHQVLINLCANAAQAMEKNGGVLTVELARVDLEAKDFSGAEAVRPGRYICLRVQDTGHGIEPGLQQRIFDPYFTTKDVGKGSGMGLAVVHGIVKSHGGLLKVESTPGEGTVFLVFFPEIDGQGTTEQQESVAIQTGHERILLVDDEVAIAEMGREMLEALGYSVVAESSSIAALDIFRADPDSFDLVITDQAMPKMQGDGLARAILQLRPEIPVILCTGYSAAINEEEASKVGICQYLMKPLSMQALAGAVRKALDGTCE